jgi:hypothetical protein
MPKLIALKIRKCGECPAFREKGDHASLNRAERLDFFYRELKMHVNPQLLDNNCPLEDCL